MKNFYYNSPLITMEFIDEVFIRTLLSLEALDTLISYMEKVPKGKREVGEFKFIRYMSRHFAIVEFCALFDGKSRLSLKIEKDKDNLEIKIQSSKLKKLFPSFPKNKLNRLHEKLNSIFKKNKKLMFKLIWTRNNKIAHANISYFEFLNKEKEIEYRKSVIEDLKKFIEEIQFLFEGVMFE